MWAQGFQPWGVCGTPTEVTQAHGSLRPDLTVPAPHTDLWVPKGIRQQRARRWAGGPPLTRHPGSGQDLEDDGVGHGRQASGRCEELNLCRGTVVSRPCQPVPIPFKAGGRTGIGRSCSVASPSFSGRDSPSPETPCRSWKPQAVIPVQTSKIHQEKGSQDSGPLSAPRPAPGPPSTTAAAVWVVPGREE